MDNQPQKKEIGIELTKETAAGNYSNLAIITHSGSEFFIDFARLMPGVPKAQVVSRIIMTPEHAKRLLLALKDNVAKYESQNGEIKLTSGAPRNTIPFGFGPNTPEA
ncbi:MAG TPA: DUF3467 domain-containing protein [Candidatus Coprenecus stercoravium]|uniref:DUF3467 domain-containing protein n=1 Tax=Candidatus Coprenecus stercoravium TaxID=2840735 RepID=A0A9D2GSC4_9BACT|nr:DUF3467 domain-containing protein [Candidatus Coprenecus stercoravium]